MESAASRIAPLGVASQRCESSDLPGLSACGLAPGRPTPGLPILPRPSITRGRERANINALPISYAFQPRLRGRLTLGRLPSPRKPWVFGEQVFHLFYRYSCQHCRFSAVHLPFRKSFAPRRTLPYHSARAESKASAARLAPIHFRRGAVEPVSYYAFFKRWLLLSQRPGCQHGATTFSTERALGGLSCWSGLLPSRQRTLAPAV